MYKIPSLSTAAALSLALSAPALGQGPGTQIPPAERPIQFDRPQLMIALAESSRFIQADIARERFGVDGSGLTAAVLDTGLRATHVDFQNRVVAQRNFTNDDGGDATKVTDLNGHGTNVTGIIAANKIHTGIAPGSAVIPLKVLPNNGPGSFAAIDAALGWVLDNKEKHGITVVNMSLGDTQNYTDDSAYLSGDIARKISELRSHRIAVIVSAGNDFFRHDSTQGMGFPAILRSTISVGAVYDADEGKFSYADGAVAESTGPGRITPFSQRLHPTFGSTSQACRTDIFSPGAPVTSSGSSSDTGQSIQHGTSQAAPITAGVVLLLQELYKASTGELPPVDLLEDTLRTGGVSIVDGDDEKDNVRHTGLTFIRLDALGALTSLQNTLRNQLISQARPEWRPAPRPDFDKNVRDEFAPALLGRAPDWPSVLENTTTDLVTALDSEALSPQREYGERYDYRISLRSEFDSSNCSPATPVATINGYRTNVDNRASQLRGIVNTLNSDSLHMAEFAKATNAYSSYLRSLPNDFCIGDSNQSAFNRLKASIADGNRIAASGIKAFERNFSTYSGQVTSRLQKIYASTRAIGPSSTDFRTASAAIMNYQAYVSRFRVEVWNLSEQIRRSSQALRDLTSETSSSVRSAVSQMESNVGAVTSRIQSARKEGDKQKKYWDSTDGAEGYAGVKAAWGQVTNDLAPRLARFVPPNTQVIQSLIGSARDNISALEAAFNGFPAYNRLPGPSSAFPYTTYGNDKRKYGQDPIIDVLRASCLAHKKETGHTLFVGDLSYQHGGRAKPHKSHRTGIDADVDPVEIGNVGQAGYDRSAALAAAKRFLQAGASTVFYGEQSVVDDANAWAKQNSIAGRLQYEAGHKRHFHLRK